MQAAERPVRGHVAALGRAVSVLVGVRAQHARPAFAVWARVNHPPLVQPGEDVIGAVVLHAQRARAVTLHRPRRHAQRGADTGQRELALGVELHQARYEPLAALLQVRAAGQAEVAHRVAGARVGVAGVSDGADGRGKLALPRLRVELERIPPLEVARTALNLPRRLQRRRLRLGAHVVQHHHKDKFAVRRRSAHALGHAVYDVARGVRIPSLPLAAFLARHERRPSGLDRTVSVVADRLEWLLQHIQKGLPFSGQRFEVRFKRHCFSLG